MNKCIEINIRIRQAAKRAALTDGLPAAEIEEFLRTGGSPTIGSKTLYCRAQLEVDAAYGRAEVAGLRHVFDLLSELLPAEAREAVPIGNEQVRRRIEPMVRGLVPDEWQEIALHEMLARTFVLNLPGARAAFEAELSTHWRSTARNVLWAFFSDYGLIPNDVVVGFEGVCGGSYAHCRWSFYHSGDAYSDVVVHEAAHLLHYLKPELFGLEVPKTKERFVDVDFRHRELFAYACEAYSRVIQYENRASRLEFAAKMRHEAFSFPSEQLGPISDLVMAAARARNGWRTIRDATVISGRRRTSIAQMPAAVP